MPEVSVAGANGLRSASEARTGHVSSIQDVCDFISDFSKMFVILFQILLKCL